MRTSALVTPLLLAISARSQVNVITANYDPNRTNADLKETILNTSNVRVNQFGKLFTRNVDAVIFAQPLYVAGTPGTHNTVFVATMNNSIYAFDADNPSASRPLWHANLGPPVPTSIYPCPGAATPLLGILGTPVISLASHTLYVVANTYESGVNILRLHALDFRSGKEMPNSPVAIQGSVSGTGPDSQNGVITFNPVQHIQRPGLALAGGNVYVGVGSHCELPPYHGWIFAYNASNIQQQTGIFNDTPDGDQAALWQSGRAPAVDGAGNIYVETANGDWDGVRNFGQSVLKLNGTLALADWFTPDNWQDSDDHDWDLGAAGPMLLPGTNLLLAGSKQGLVYLTQTSSLGHLETGNSQIVQSFQATSYWAVGMAYWNNSNGPLLYVWGWGDYLKSYTFANGVFNSVPSAQGPAQAPFPGGMLTLSANGSTPGTGILWTSTRLNKNTITPSILAAYDASNVSVELWDSTMNSARDGVGYNAKFVPPTVANGKVYMATDSNQLVVYGLLPQ